MNYKLAYQQRLMFEGKIKEYKMVHHKHQKQISKPQLVLKAHKPPINTRVNAAQHSVRQGRPFFTGNKGF
jgi:hypothetical protein